MGLRRDRIARLGVTRRLLAAAIGLAVGLLAVTAGPPAGASSGKASSPLKAGLAFYRGKNILMVVPASPGGIPDLSARLAIPYMESYLHASIDILDNGAGGSFPAQDQAAGANPDGLTVGLLSPGNDISAVLAHTPALNFNPIRETFLGQSGTAINIFVASPTSAYRSFAQLAAVPASDPATILTLSSGVPLLYVKAVVGVFGLHAKVLTAYPTTASMLQGFLRGDGPISAFSTGMIGSPIEAGKAIPILVTTPLAKGLLPALAPFLRGVPTLTELAKRYPPRTRKQQEAFTALLDIANLSGSVYFVPPKTPSDRVVALEAALRYAFGPVSRANALTEGVAPGFTSGTDSKRLYVTALANGAALASYLNS